jgi:poly-gamma-glutamate synthesis protein (capsule biosynthesis protein)
MRPELNLTRRVAGTVSLLLVGCGGQSASADGTLSVVFAGDLMLAEGAGETIARGKDPFAGVAAVLAGSDLRVANLECAVAHSGQEVPKQFTFRAEPATLDVLARHFDAVSVANNHSGDFGDPALLETLGGLDRVRVGRFGAGRNLIEAHEPLFIERKGVVVALLGYDEFRPRSFEAGPDSAGVAWSEDEQVVRDIRNARARGADVVIPFMHWGWENEAEPCERQRELSRLMIDAGADAVIGAHPHVTQGVETYRSRPIYYSLGNFVFSSLDYEANHRGWLARLELTAQGVVRWETLVVNLDDQGSPTWQQDQAAPCGRRGQNSVSQCVAAPLGL